MAIAATAAAAAVQHFIGIYRVVVGWHHIEQRPQPQPNANSRPHKHSSPTARSSVCVCVALGGGWLRRKCVCGKSGVVAARGERSICTLATCVHVSLSVAHSIFISQQTGSSYGRREWWLSMSHCRRCRRRRVECDTLRRWNVAPGAVLGKMVQYIRTQPMLLYAIYEMALGGYFFLAVEPTLFCVGAQIRQ